MNQLIDVSLLNRIEMLHDTMDLSISLQWQIKYIMMKKSYAKKFWTKIEKNVYLLLMFPNSQQGERHHRKDHKNLLGH